MSSPLEVCVITGAKPRKVRNVCLEEEEQCCHFVMNISMDAIMQGGGLAKKKLTFWTKVSQHYAKHKLKGGIGRHAQSLETKWVTIRLQLRSSQGATNPSRSVTNRWKHSTILSTNRKCKKLDFKHYWQLLHTYPKFASIFKPMGKMKVGHPLDFWSPHRSLREVGLGCKFSTFTHHPTGTLSARCWAI